jgi:cytosine/adenosine deaminase-related metal-dependent hydrolase
MALVIAGRIVPMNRTDPAAVFAGRVYLGDDGFVEAVMTANAAVPTGFANAPVVNAGDAFVLPGLIDLHNHLGYNALPLWIEPTQTKPFLHHNDWPTKPSYKPDITWPAWVLAKADPEALLAYVQARALVGGTTAIQGWPSFNRLPQIVVRDIDDEEAGTTNRNLIYTSVITETPAELIRTAKLMNHGAGFIYHCAEGQPGSVVAHEFIDAANAGCLEKTLVAIHCNAVADSDWPRWQLAKAGAVAWSPFSNLWLYGKTTNVPAAQKQGISICLGSDWGPSGTKHVLGEVKVAKLVSQQQGFGLTDRDLVAMITSNPGDALSRCWSKQVGRLVPGSFADVTVLNARGNADVWSQVVKATEREVALVVVGGKARYGDSDLMTAAAATPASTLTIAGRQRKIALSDPTDNSKAFQWSDIVSRLNAVRKSPKTALEHADARSRRRGGALSSAQTPLELELDMPSGNEMVAVAIPPDPAKVVIPPLPTLVHDEAFFNYIHGRGFHGGLLDGLAEFYSGREL